MTRAKSERLMNLLIMLLSTRRYVTRDEIRSAIDGYNGTSEGAFERQFERDKDELRALGLDGHTLLIFTSDNGSRCRGEGGSNAPLRGTKGTTWEGGMRAPAVVRWPSLIARRRETRTARSAGVAASAFLREDTTSAT